MGLDCSTRKPPDPSHDNGGKRMKGNFPLAQFFTANWVTSNKRTPSPNKEHPHGFNARYLLQSTGQKEPWNGKPENLILVPIQALALDRSGRTGLSKHKKWGILAALFLTHTDLAFNQAGSADTRIK